MAKRRERLEIAPMTKRKRVFKTQGNGIVYRFPKFLKYMPRRKSNAGLITNAPGTKVISECVKATDMIRSNKEDPLPPKEEKPQPPGKQKPLPKVNYDDLVIQEIGMGEADGTKVTSHSKVLISFICATFEGEIFASGKCQFQLGSGEVIQGLNRGVKGMRVGDIRRLMMPSSCRVGGEEPWRVPSASISRTITCQVTLDNVEN